MVEFTIGINKIEIEINNYTDQELKTIINYDLGAKVNNQYWYKKNMRKLHNYLQLNYIERF